MRQVRDTDSIPNDIKVNLLRDLTSMPGWSILVSWLEDEVDRLDGEINTVNPEHNKLLYTQKDILILDKQNIKNLIEAPASITRSIKPVNNFSVTVEEALKDNGLIDLSFATDPTGII